MSHEERPSPRQEALYAILETQATTEDTTISETAWNKLVTLAWDTRSHVGDRREIRRQIKAILMDDARMAGDN